MENKKEEPFDYELAKQKLREQFRTGKSLFSKGGAFAPLLQEMLNSMLEGEIEAHLDEEQRSVGNRRNGKSSKLLKTSAGTIEVNTPRDRQSSFEPEIVRKRETIMAQSLEDKIIGLYGLGHVTTRYLGSYQGDLRHGHLRHYTKQHYRQGDSPGKRMAAKAT